MPEINATPAKILIGNTKNKSLRYRIFSWIREIISVSFWFYLILKTFVFDFDFYILNLLAPEWTWVIYLKFPILIGLIGMIWLFTKNKDVLLFALYIVFYPVIVIFKIVFYTFKTSSWLFSIGIINFILSLFRSIKYKFIIFSFSIVLFALIFLSDNKIILSCSIILLLAILLLVFVKRFYYVFRPSVLYQKHSKLVTKLLDWGRKTWAPAEDLASVTITNMNTNQLQTWSNNLQYSVVANRFCYFFSSKLKKYQKSNTSVAFDIVNIFVLTLITVVFFSVINLSLYKINVNSFTTTVQPDFFMFFYYSITGLFGRGIIEIVPVTNISRIISVLEMIFTFSLFGILVSLFLSVKEKRDSEEIDTAIKLIKDQGSEMETFIKDKYKLTINDAISELEKLKAGFIKFIFYLSRNIDLE